ncbi:MAG: TonB-dependent receptor [Verrucomicrobiota bacterium]
MKRRSEPWKLAAFAGWSLVAGSAAAQDALENLGALEPLTVIGSPEEILGLPGSGYVVPTEDIRMEFSGNVNRVLARVPGVYVREEDGYGNFPNISIRGGDGTRSEKVTMMEDGILSAPAPYSAPAAYYSPRAARMSGIEILKGSSQVRYGPQTTGGVINYLSTPIPEDHHFYTRNTYGSDNTFMSHSYFGDVIETEAGRFGYLLELFFQNTDGFRTIDPGAGGFGDDDAGFSVVEPMFKFFWEPNSDIPQRLEFKYGFTELDADETYTGLTELDARFNPDRRYASTRFDNMTTRQHRTYLKYLIQPNENLDLEAAIYYNKFNRNWAKLDDATLVPFGDRNDPGSVRQYLVQGGAGLALLQGSGPGTLIRRNNNREYEAYGAQFTGEYRFQTGQVGHELSFGGRYHTDYIRRFQNDINITLDGVGDIANVDVEAAGAQGNRRQESDAIAIWIQDRIDIGALAITPGLRYETIDQSYVDFNNGQSGDNSFDLISPGISFNYEFAEFEEVFGGVYRGYSIPGPRSAARSGVEEEESIGYELGIRTNRCGVRAELVGFLTDFDNLIATDAGLNQPTNRNVGEAQVWGFESLITYDPLETNDRGIRLPMYATATWTSAELKSNVTGGGSDDIYSGGVDGSAIPYVPEWKLAAGIGVATECWGANLDMTYTSKTFGGARNLDAPIDPDPEGLWAREGKIDALLLFDFSTYYQVTEQVKLIGGVDNIFDERGIVSRIPRGPRANNGRTAFVGFEGIF